MPEEKHEEKIAGKNAADFRFYKSVKYWIAVIYAVFSLLSNLIILINPSLAVKKSIWGLLYVGVMALTIVSLLLMNKWKWMYWLCVGLIGLIILIFTLSWFEIGLIGFWMYLLWRDGIRKPPQAQEPSHEAMQE